MSNDDEIQIDDTMDTKSEPLGDLFKQRKQWVVPIYQRSYVWKSEQDDQIPGMWEDWRDKANQILKHGKARTRPHYFGAIIYSHNRDIDDEFFKNILVDGQQRLTTFQLAFAALRDTGKELECENAKDVEKYLLNKFDDDPPKKDDVYKLLPSLHDRDVFKRIISPHKSSVDDSDYELTRAYEFFCIAIEKFVNARKKDKEPEELIDVLKEALLEKFKVVTIQLGNYDDAQQIFASLNGKGQPLSAFDLIRNDVFYRAFQEYGKEYKKIARRFEDEWGYFEKPFWTKEVARARVTKARANHFITDVVIAQVAKDVIQGRIAAEYKKYATESMDDSFKQLEILKKYAVSYRALQKPKDGEVTARIARMLKLWDLSTMNPLVMWIDTRTSLTNEEKDKLFLMIESYVVRRGICNQTTKHFNKTVPAILADMQNQTTNIIGVLKDFLENEKTDTKKMPTDEEVSKACRDLPFYKNMSSPKRIYIMQCIQADLADTPYGENPTQKKLSIEHIMPQKWSTHWTLPNGETVLDEDYSSEKNLNLDGSFQALMEERKIYINKIGNLTLVTPKFNSKLRNKDWQTKRAEIITNSQIEINHEIVKKDEWNEDTIKERSEYLAKRINKIWPSS